MAARGLYATMVTWCDHQIYTRPDSFDGTFDLKRVRSVGGTVRLVRELVENGLFEEAGEGVYRVVTRRGLAVFGSFKNQKKPLTPEEAAELHEKKVVAGHAGGKASGESRRAKAEANRKQNEADAKQTASTSTKQTGSTTVPNQTKTMPSSSLTPPGQDRSKPRRSPRPRPGRWPTRSPRRGTPTHATPARDGKPKAWAAAVAGHDGTSAVTEAQLIGAVIAYAKTVDDPRYAPNMSRWLRQGAYMDTMPSQPKPYRHALPDGTVIDDRWIAGHIRDHVPVGTFTDAMRADFWASVKTGIDPEQKAKEIINECQRKASR